MTSESKVEGFGVVERVFLIYMLMMLLLRVTAGANTSCFAVRVRFAKANVTLEYTIINNTYNHIFNTMAASIGFSTHGSHYRRYKMFGTGKSAMKRRRIYQN
jgi:hypothetical protein